MRKKRYYTDAVDMFLFLFIFVVGDGGNAALEKKKDIQVRVRGSVERFRAQRKVS